MTTKPTETLLNNYFFNSEFKDYASLNPEILSKQGIYCIRLKGGSVLPEPFQSILNTRAYEYIYIGKSDCTLRTRLEQEIKHKKAGTFFRSIGAVLGFEPIIGHLYGKKSCNFKFSKTDTALISQWLINNVDIFIKEESTDIEEYLIEYYSPLLNWDYNKNKCMELRAKRDRCLSIARKPQYERTF